MPGAAGGRPVPAAGSLRRDHALRGLRPVSPDFAGLRQLCGAGAGDELPRGSQNHPQRGAEADRRGASRRRAGRSRV